MKCSKGDYGYLSLIKKKRAAITILLCLGMAAMIGFGYWRYRTLKTIFTVVGILFSLPIAKILSGLFVILPFKPCTDEKHREILGRLPKLDAWQILWDLALSSEEKVRHFPCTLISDHCVLVLYEEKKSKAESEAARIYFKNILKNNCHRAEFIFTDQTEEFLTIAASRDFTIKQPEEARRIRDTIFVYEM